MDVSGDEFCKVVAWPPEAMDPSSGELVLREGLSMYGQETVRCPDGADMSETYEVELMVSDDEGGGAVVLFGMMESASGIVEVGTSANPISVEVDGVIEDVNFIFGP